jgi:peptidoglycan/LPS O-acetylase OafA/YrhL
MGIQSETAFVRLPALDGIRGLAIICVMAYHFTNRLLLNDIINEHTALTSLMYSGWLGVDLFFALSGYLITGILCDTKKSQRYFSSFYGRRVLRIFPLYYANLAIFFLVIPVLIDIRGTEFEILNKNQLWFWTYTSNFLQAKVGGFGTIPGGYFWSLAVEEQFYIIWPLIVIALNPSQLLTICSTLLIAGVGLRLALLYNGVDASVLYVIPFTHLDSLLTGSIVAITTKYSINFGVRLRWFHLAALASLAGILWLAVTRGGFEYWDKSTCGFGILFLAIINSWCVYNVILLPGGTLAKVVFSRGFLQSFGRYSYGLYLIHMPVGLGLDKAMLDRAAFPSPKVRCILFFLSAFSLSWVLAWLSWHAFEKRFLNLKKYFPYK